MLATSELCSWDTELSADAVEWCPAEGFEDLLLVGTYQVDPNDTDSFDASQRRGRLSLLQVHFDGEAASASERLAVKQSLDTQAILDVKWCPQKHLGRIVVACADAKGYLQLYALDEQRLVLDLIDRLKVTGESEALALSLAWSACRSAPARIAVSDSKGKIHLVHLDSRLQVVSSFEAHDFEAWATCFDASDANLVYSGGDDSLLKFFDLRHSSSPARVIRGKHEAGVTSLKSSSKTEFKLFSGSYDENLFAWDTRKAKDPVSSLSLGGGVWRIKEDAGGRLALACMGNGFTVVDVTQDKSQLQLAAHFKEHSSLAYGVDWMHGQRKNVIASCSFYDHLLKVWSVQ